MHKRRMISLFAFMLAIMFLFVACAPGASSSGNESVTTTSTEQTDDPMPIVLMLRNYSSPPDGWEEASAEMSRLALEQGNFDLEIICEASATMTETLNMMFSGGETIDIFMAAQTRYTPYVAQNMCLPLDDLLDQYGQDLMARYEGMESILNAGVYNGEIFGITPLSKKAKFNVFACRKDILDQYNLSLDDIMYYTDLEPILNVIHENEPDMNTLTRATTSNAMSRVHLLGSEDYDTSNYELLGPVFSGVLIDDSWNVVNLYETDEYYDVISNLHDWNNKGYFAPDIVTLTGDEQGFNSINAGNTFGFFVYHDANIDWLKSTPLSTYELDYCALSDPEVSIVGFLVGIGATSPSPENAMKFMNYAWNSTEFNTTMIRGTQYEVVDEEKGIVSLPEGVESLDYRNNGFHDMFGNYTLAWQWDTDPENYGQAIIESNKEAKTSRTLGFSFDSSVVVDQMTACQNVFDQYYQALENGALDPDTAIPEFNAALKAAGLDDIIAEKQAQLDAWVEANNK